MKKAILKFNAIVLAAMFTLAAALGIATCTGCTTASAESRATFKTELAAVTRLAYDAAGRELVNARIDKLVAAGKITEEQAACLRAAAEAVYERAVTRLEGDSAAATNATAEAACDACAVDTAGACAADGGACADE